MTFRGTASRAVIVSLFAGISLNLAVAGTAVAQWGGFTDVSQDAYYADAVVWMRDNKITAGCGVDKYCPNDPVSRGQMALFMQRLSDRGPIPARKNLGGEVTHAYLTSNSAYTPHVLAAASPLTIPEGPPHLFRVVWLVNNGMHDTPEGTTGATCASGIDYNGGPRVRVNNKEVGSEWPIPSQGAGVASGGEVRVVVAAGTHSFDLISAPHYCSQVTSAGSVGPMRGRVLVYDEGAIE